MGFYLFNTNLLPSLTRGGKMWPFTLDSGLQKKGRDLAGLDAGTCRARRPDRILPRNLSGGQQQRVAIARAFGERSTTAGLRRTDSALDGPERPKDHGAGSGDVDEPPDRCVIVVTHDSRVFHLAIAWRTHGRTGIVGIHPIQKEATA